MKNWDVIELEMSFFFPSLTLYSTCPFLNCFVNRNVSQVMGCNVHLVIINRTEQTHDNHSGILTVLNEGP